MTGDQKVSVTPDTDYDFIAEQKPTKKGIQCGKCGMKFDYNKAYGFYCGQSGCPTQLQPSF